jgi:arylsulfatase A-like enzyme
VAWWPGTIPPGTGSTATAMTMDLFPTFLDLAGLPMPTERPLDGISLKEVFVTGKPLPKRLLFWDNVRGKAVRDGKMKLVVINDPREKIRTRELFDLETDPGETKDLAKSQPEVAARLFQELTQWEKEVEDGTTVQPFYKDTSTKRRSL